MARTRRSKRGALRAAAFGVFIQRATAWNIVQRQRFTRVATTIRNDEVVAVRNIQLQPLTGGKLMLPITWQPCSRVAAALHAADGHGDSYSRQLTRTIFSIPRDLRISRACRGAGRSDHLQELENLPAMATIGEQPQERPMQQSHKNQHAHGNSGDVTSARGAGADDGGEDGGGGGKEEMLRAQGAKRKLQSVDFTTALVMSRELAQTVVPARVENVFQLDPHNIAIGLRTLEGNLWLHVCWHPQGARCHVGGPPPREREQKAYTFSQTLRSLIRGLNIVKVGLARPFERVVALDLATRLGEPPSYRMYVEIMASRSNVVLVAVDAQGVETVAACAYQVSPSKSVRPLSTGQAYELPPAMTARRPSQNESLEDFVEGVGRVPTVQLKKALVGVYQGTSPALVNTMVSCVPSLAPSIKVGNITPSQWNDLYSGPWKRWVELVGDGTTSSEHARVGAAGDYEESSARNITPWLSADGLVYYPTTLEGSGDVETGEGRGDGREAAVSYESLQQVMERYYRATQSNDEFDGLKRRCLTRIRATLTRLRERAADFEGQLEAAQEGKVAELNRRGDLLVTYGHSWTPGETHVDCVDFETGEDVAITINPDKNPVEEAQIAFKLGKKLKRSAAIVRDLLDQVNAQLVYAEGIEMALEQLNDGSTDSSSGRSGGGNGGRHPPADARSNSIVVSREELSVLRGISEELGLQGGKEAARRFTSLFGVKQAQLSGVASFDGMLDRKGKAGRGSDKAGTTSGKKSRVDKGKAKRAQGRGGGGGGRGGAGDSKSRESPTAGLLGLRRAPGSPTVLVGRNNLQNDRLTFSVAKVHELWFHARGVAGAHVLLRLQPGQDVEDEDLEFAADVAIYFSKARQSASTAVDFISPKAIKKMGGGGPGMVKYDGAKVTRGEPKRVEALVTEALRQRAEEAR